MIKFTYNIPRYTSFPNKQSKKNTKTEFGPKGSSKEKLKMDFAVFEGQFFYPKIWYNRVIRNKYIHVIYVKIIKNGVKNQFGSAVFEINEFGPFLIIFPMSYQNYIC
jgi:hypothetical protein